MTKSGLTNTLQRLHARSLIRVGRCQADGRRKRIWLTSDDRRACGHSMMAAIKPKMEDLRDGFTQKEFREELCRSSRRCEPGSTRNPWRPAFEFRRGRHETRRTSGGGPLVAAYLQVRLRMLKILTVLQHRSLMSPTVQRTTDRQSRTQSAGSLLHTFRRPSATQLAGAYVGPACAQARAAGAGAGPGAEAAPDAGGSPASGKLVMTTRARITMRLQDALTIARHLADRSTPSIQNILKLACLRARQGTTGAVARICLKVDAGRGGGHVHCA